MSGYDCRTEDGRGGEGRGGEGRGGEGRGGEGRGGEGRGGEGREMAITLEFPSDYQVRQHPKRNPPAPDYTNFSTDNGS